MSLKSLIRVNLNKALEPMGFQVNRFLPESTTRYMLSARLRERQLHYLRRELEAHLADFPDLSIDTIGDAEIAGFLGELAGCPVKQQIGGSGVNAALLLWLLTRMIQPSLVVESGVLRGFTSWVLERAAPSAEIHSFDLSFADLRFRSGAIHYHESDWMSFVLAPPDPSKSLAFFDDHVDQWRRVREAAERGFRYLIFDDSMPANALHGDGDTAYPSLDMLFDDELPDGEVMEWQTECGRFSFRYDRALALETRRLVRNHVRLPSLHLITGYSPANLTLLEIARDL